MIPTPIKEQIYSHALYLYKNADVKNTLDPTAPTARVIDLNILDVSLKRESSDHNTMRARALSLIDLRNIGLNCAKLLLVAANVYQLMFGSPPSIIMTGALSLIARSVILKMQRTLTLNSQFYSSISEMNRFYKHIVTTASNDFHLLVLIEMEFEKRNLIQI